MIKVSWLDLVSRKIISCYCCLVKNSPTGSEIHVAIAFNFIPIKSLWSIKKKYRLRKNITLSDCQKWNLQSKKSHSKLRPISSWVEYTEQIIRRTDRFMLRAMKRRTTRVASIRQWGNFVATVGRAPSSSSSSGSWCVSFRVPHWPSGSCCNKAKGRADEDTLWQMLHTGHPPHHPFPDSWVSESPTDLPDHGEQGSSVV